MGMRLTFLGSGDAFGTGGRFNTCFHVATGSDNFLIDCGATSLVAMRRFKVEPNAIGMVLLTHLHGDHFGGLPFFILDAQLISRRRTPLNIVGPVGLKQRLYDTMKVLFPGSEKIQQKFELNLVEIEPGRAHRVGPAEVTPFIAAHNAGAPAFTLRIACEGKTLTYSGDTGWCDSLVRAADGADMLIVESSGYDKEIPQHLDYGTLSRRRDELKARTIVLTHMGPEMLANRGSVKGFELAEDGKSFEI
jgi:ribonuclease BN (tRNA processing enzyme)